MLSRSCSLSLFALVAVLGAVACSDDSSTTAQSAAGAGGSTGGSGGSSAGSGGSDLGGAGNSSGGTAGTAGTTGGQGGGGMGGTTGGTGGGGAGGAALQAQQYGARVWGPTLAISRTDRSLWLGTIPLPAPDDAAPTKRLGGLYRLNLDSGLVDVYDDEFPQGEDPNFPGMPGAMASASVIKDGAREIIVAREGLVIHENDSFTLHELTLPSGIAASPTHAIIDRDGGRNRVIVSSNAGLLFLNPDTLAIESSVTASDLQGDIGTIVIDPDSGDIYGVLYPQGGTNSNKLVKVTDSVVATLSPGENQVPLGYLGDLVWSKSKGAVLAALGSWDAYNGGGVISWDGTNFSTFITEGQLSLASNGVAQPFGTSALVLSEADDVLVVGGTIAVEQPSGFLAGGGIAWVQLSTGKLTGISTSTSHLVGDHITALAYDDVTHRTYAQLRQPCNEVQLGNPGLVAISFDDNGKPRIERPLLSGVRSILQDGEQTLLGVRDDNPGVSCDGFPIQTGLLELRANGSGEIIPLQSVSQNSSILPNAGPVKLASNSQGTLGVATWRDGAYFGSLSGGQVYNPAIDFNTSLYMLDIAWVDDTHLWVTGHATHGHGDPDNLADVGPRGAALLTLDQTGLVSEHKHFVRESNDAKDIVGLPSGEINSVVLASDGSSYLVCSRERFTDSSYDRLEDEPFSVQGQFRSGGIAHILADGSLGEVVTADDLMDPRVAAFTPDGKLIVLDSVTGAFSMEGGAVSPYSLPVSLPSGAIPHQLIIDENAFIVSLSTGAIIALGTQTMTLDQVGHAWGARKHESGAYYVGTDQGLVVVSSGDGLSAPPIVPGSTPPFKSIDAPTNPGGMCAGAGQPCDSQPAGCCPGLSCSSGIVPQCE